MKHLSPTDVGGQHPWADQATLVCTDRRTVHIVNAEMARRFAASRGLPVVAWHLPLEAKYEGRLGRSGEEQLYDRVRDLTAYFVQDAPAVLTANIRPEKGLSNGTRCRLHSLVLHPSEPDTTWERLASAAPGEVVFLEEPPFAVNVVTTSEDGSAIPEGLRVHRTTEEDGSDEYVIPLLPRSRRIQIARYLLKFRGKAR